MSILRKKLAMIRKAEELKNVEELGEDHFAYEAKNPENAKNVFNALITAISGFEQLHVDEAQSEFGDILANGGGTFREIFNTTETPEKIIASLKFLIEGLDNYANGYRNP